MPEYYFDEIDTSRLGLISLLASNLEFLSKVFHAQQASTKKELCQEIYDKPYIPSQSEMNAKKEFGTLMFSQSMPPLPPDYQKLLFPMGDSSGPSVSGVKDFCYPPPSYQRTSRPENEVMMGVSRQMNSDKGLSSATIDYRVDMRDACTSTSSPLHPGNPPISSKCEDRGCDLPITCMSGFKTEKDADFHMTLTNASTNTLRHSSKSQSVSEHLQEPQLANVVNEKIKPEIVNTMNLVHPLSPQQEQYSKRELPSTSTSVDAIQSINHHDNYAPDSIGCSGDSKTATDVQIKAVHMEKNQVYKCGQCSEIFKARRALIRHMRSHPAEKSYPCDQCGKLFSRNSALINHKRTHSKDKAYICDQCGMTMPTRNDLSSHELTHVGVRPFVCQDCGKSFKKAGALSTHRKLHTGDTPFVCEFCGKAFTSNGNLENHVRVHSGDKPYLCEYCGKAFNTTANLNRHVRIHTGEKPYVCDWCTKAFSQSYALVIHKRIHTGEQPYFCKQCGKTFSDNSTLYKHKRIHKESVGGTTIMIPSKFSRKGSLVQLPVNALNAMNSHMSSLAVTGSQTGMSNTAPAPSPVALQIPSFASSVPMVGPTLMSVSSISPNSNVTAAAAAAVSMSVVPAPDASGLSEDIRATASHIISVAPGSRYQSDANAGCLTASQPPFVSASVDPMAVNSILPNGSTLRTLNSAALIHHSGRSAHAQSLNPDITSMTV